MISWGTTSTRLGARNVPSKPCTQKLVDGTEIAVFRQQESGRIPEDFRSFVFQNELPVTMCYFVSYEISCLLIRTFSYHNIPLNARPSMRIWQRFDSAIGAYQVEVSWV